MVYRADGNPQLDSRDWSMYWNILNGYFSLNDFHAEGSVQRAKIKGTITITGMAGRL